MYDVVTRHMHTNHVQNVFIFSCTNDGSYNRQTHTLWPHFVVHSFRLCTHLEYFKHWAKNVNVCHCSDYQPISHIKCGRCPRRLAAETSTDLGKGN